MSLEDAPLEPDDNADPNWFAPIAMLIAWLAHLFDQIAKLKRIRRNTRFKPNWRDHWLDLRQCEWMRDQILAAGAAQLLAGKDLDLDAFTPSTEPPADYGGPCPKTPFDMNRRFLAMARFNADPEPAIRAHAMRIARRAGIDLNSPLRHDATHRDTSPGFAGGGKAPAPLASLADRRGGGARLRATEGAATAVAALPLSSQTSSNHPPRTPRARDRRRMPDPSVHPPPHSLTRPGRTDTGPPHDRAHPPRIPRRSEWNRPIRAARPVHPDRSAR